jgi:hypothetical protein
MIELRWVRTPHTTTAPAELQFRVHLPVVDIGGSLCPGDWTEWQNVPTVVIDPEETP